jgi:hypothetical protein
MKAIYFAGLLLIATAVKAQDWPQACYNEVSMWVTNACKTYIEEVYLPAQETISDAPSPVLGTGLGGLALFIGGAAVIIVRRQRRHAKYNV